jgi:solute carrier family 35, member E1
MVSLGAGPVSFTHIVKALEPFFSALVSALYLGVWMKPAVYATLIPVVGGVGYACLKEKSFSWLAFSMAMVSNVAFALRAVLSKAAMSTTDAADGSSSTPNVGTNMTPPNVFAMVTLASFLISIPLALIGEGRSFGGTWTKALGTTQENANIELIKAIIVSGLFHYLNNEVMYLALGSVHPVTLAVGNTVKRVFIILASVLFFHNDFSLQAGIGSGIGLGGVLLYSLTKQHYEKMEALEAKAKRNTAAKKKATFVPRHAASSPSQAPARKKTLVKL